MAGERPGVPPAASHWAFIPPERPAPPEVRTNGLGAEPDRPLHPGPRSSKPGSPRRPRPTATTLIRRAEPRPDRLAPVARGGRRVPGRSIRPDRLRARRRPPAGLAALRRAVGAALARPGPLRRLQRLQHRRPALDLEVPRLGHRRPQRATCRSTSSRSTRSPATSGPTPRWPSRSPPGSTATRRSTRKAGIDVEQFRVESVVDRVNTTGTVFLGLTIGCAQCHDHKYDPISQREYYRLFAFFNNVDEPDLEIATPAELARRERDPARRSTRSTASSTPSIPTSTTRERPWEKTLAPAFKQTQAAEVKAGVRPAAREADDRPAARR